ncbi:MAG TPA: zinc ribbon domain-containing protein [Gaiellaceae bacterium]|nr:zinc ribbon domain-containing protein [Gaiellaceae bacterium]
MTWSFFGSVHGFFHSTTWSVIETLGALLAVILWGATVFWVWKDARRRIASPVLVSVATVFGAVLPFLGPLVYMLFRPPEYLEDVRERELEIRAIEKRLMSRECPVCGAEAEPDFLVCPVCTTRLRQACANCNRPLEPAWAVCPYCETKPSSEEPRPLRPKRPVRATRPRPEPRSAEQRAPGTQAPG